jgi:hypothetical protein
MSEETLESENFDLRMKISEVEYKSAMSALDKAGWPPALAKATHDSYDYAIGLKDGTVIFFERATSCGGNHEWVSLWFQSLHDGTTAYHRSFNKTHGIGGNDRGLEVRVSEIVWASDAPYGS